MAEVEIIARRRKWRAEEKAALLAEVEGGRGSRSASRDCGKSAVQLAFAG
jgi:hypothetical protein